MTWTEILEHWPHLKAQAQSKWAKLSADELAMVSGDRARLITLLEERYGLPADEGAVHVDEWSRYEARRS